MCLVLHPLHKYPTSDRLHFSRSTAGCIRPYSVRSGNLQLRQSRPAGCRIVYTNISGFYIIMHKHGKYRNHFALSIARKQPTSQASRHTYIRTAGRSAGVLPCFHDPHTHVIVQNAEARCQCSCTDGI